MIRGLVLFCLFSLSSLLSAQDITGYWKRLNPETGNTQCVITIYEYQEEYFGRIVSTYDDQGKMKDNLHNPVYRAEKVAGSPFYCGMDLLLNLQEEGSKYRGRIINPKSGKFYDCSVWVRDGNLVIRGEFMFFGRSETWFPIEESDFPKDFKKPNASTFVPVIPSRRDEN